MLQNKVCIVTKQLEFAVDLLITTVSNKDECSVHPGQKKHCNLEHVWYLAVALHIDFWVSSNTCKMTRLLYKV